MRYGFYAKQQETRFRPNHAHIIPAACLRSKHQNNKGLIARLGNPHSFRFSVECRNRFLKPTGVAYRVVFAFRLGFLSVFCFLLLSFSLLVHSRERQRYRISVDRISGTRKEEALFRPRARCSGGKDARESGFDVDKKRVPT